jgi:putative cell wall-binding protein
MVRASRSASRRLVLSSALAVAALVGGSLVVAAVPAAADTSPVGPGGASPAAQNAAQVAYQASVAAQHPDPGLGATAPRAGALTAQSLLTTGALTGADFNAGDIISDQNFYQGAAMSAGAIQTFLDDQGGSCTPAAGGPACLKNYEVTTTGRAGDTICPAGYTGAADQTAAEIIAEAGQSCGISQEVLLTLIQKESGLVETTAPTTAEYEQATGYACPDSSGCDADYDGLFNQIWNAAWQLKDYRTSTTFTWYPVGQATDIAYSPSASCGSAPVDIWNSATAALYYYTPYQPNAAALANLNGAGNGCSSYGNRNFWTIYSTWFGDPTVGSTPTVGRTSGSDRFSTAVAIAQQSYPSGPVPVVYIATGLNFPDALSAAPAAAASGGPLLLVDPQYVPSEVTTELATLQPEKIVVVGGTSAVDASVYSALAATPSLHGVAADITRISGSDRFATSLEIASTVFRSGTTTTAYLATGQNFPDALSAGAAAGSSDSPVILINSTESSVDSATAAELSTLGVTHIVIAGGTSVISASYATSLTSLDGGHMSVLRESGSDRFATSAAINHNAFPTAGHVYIATGMDFPDALAGAAAAGAGSSPLYVVQTGCVPAATFADVYAGGATVVTLLGGTSALSPSVAQLAACP